MYNVKQSYGQDQFIIEDKDTGGFMQFGEAPK